MTLAPVIGGSERQGFGKYSLCSGKKKRTRYRGLQKVSMMERDRKYILPGQYLTIISIIKKNGKVNQINVISKPP